MHIAHCTYETHAATILAIFNEAIAHSTALYEYAPLNTAYMRSWFDSKVAGLYPVIGAFSATGTLLGFASYGPFRTRPAFKYSIEHSVYVEKTARGKGVGRALLEQLIVYAREQQYHLMIGCIDADNTASIALHQRFGFFHTGTIKQAGFKFGRWLDLAFYQLTLDTPVQPVDG